MSIRLSVELEDIMYEIDDDDLISELEDRGYLIVENSSNVGFTRNEIDLLLQLMDDCDTPNFKLIETRKKLLLIREKSV